MSVATSSEAVRRHNLGRLLRLLHVSGAASRSTLAGQTALNRSTIKALTEDLAALGLVRTGEPQRSGGSGRPSLIVEPAEEDVFVLALSVNVEHLTALRVGLGGRVLDRHQLAQSDGDYDLHRTLRHLTRLSDGALRTAPAGSRCVAVGVSVCGVVSEDDGVVQVAPNLGWSGVPLRDLLHRALGTPLPVLVANDGDLGALAEHLRGAGRGAAHVVHVYGEVGIGGGIIANGLPVRGAGGFGGEIGHMLIDPRGRQCRCGRRGCWETEVGDAGVLQSVCAPAGSTLDDVLAAHARGERWVQPGLRRVASALGAGTANLINIFSPELVVFSGTVGRVFLALEHAVRDAAAVALAAPSSRVRLEVAELGEDAPLVGAAELAFGALLDDPVAVVEQTAHVTAAPAS